MSARRAGFRIRAGCAARALQLVALLTLLAACGGGGGNGAAMPPAPPLPPAFTSVPQVRVSQPSAFAPGCDGATPTGTLYVDTAAEPYLAVNPTNQLNLIAAWQQNRWSDGGAQGVSLASSVDGGMSWRLTSAAFSRCTGGNSGNAGNYARATDVWLTASPNGRMYALSLSFTGATLLPGSSSAMLVAQSLDGGATWTPPIALIQDGAQFFNDKGSITADPNNSSYVYAVWDRLPNQIAGPAYFAMTADAGASWQPARSIYDPGPTSQTIGHQIVVLPSDVVVDIFTQIDTAAGGVTTASLRAMHSADHGTTWSTPVMVSDLEARGTTDPQSGHAVRDGSDLASVSAGPGGVIEVVWQDARFSGGQRDGIALTHSSDAGASWSAPAQVNADHAVQAFTPTINVRPDGAIAVTYFDLRNDTFPGVFLSDCWIVVSRDGGATFQESHLSGPLDLNLAPDSQGLFLGDYQSLANARGAFLPFYVQTDAGTQVRSDASISFPPAALAAAAFRAHAAPPGMTLTAAARQHVMERLRLTQAQRLRGRGR